MKYWTIVWWGWRDICWPKKVVYSTHGRGLRYAIDLGFIEFRRWHV